MRTVPGGSKKWRLAWALSALLPLVPACQAESKAATRVEMAATKSDVTRVTRDGPPETASTPPETASLTKTTRDALDVSTARSVSPEDGNGASLASMARREPPSAPLGGEPERVGSSVTVAGERFVIWGALETGQMPKGLVTSRDGRWLVASNMGTPGKRTLSIYRADPLTLDRHLDLPGAAIELAVSDTELFLTNTRDWGTLQVFSLDDFALLRELPVPGFPKWMLLGKDARTLYVSLWALDGVSRVGLSDGHVDTLRTPKGTRTREPSRNKHPRGLALSHDGKTLYVANNADESLSLIDTATFTERARLRVGYAPRHLALAPKGDSLFVSLTGNDGVLEFDTRTETPLRELPVGKRPKTLQVSNDGRFLYAANYGDGSLSIIALETGERADLKLDVHKPSGLAVRPDDRFVYVSGFCTHDVWAIERVSDGHAPEPHGADRDNHPCFDCPSSFEGCPYYPGPKSVTPGADE